MGGVTCTKHQQEHTLSAERDLTRDARIQRALTSPARPRAMPEGSASHVHHVISPRRRPCGRHQRDEEACPSSLPPASYGGCISSRCPVLRFAPSYDETACPFQFEFVNRHASLGLAEPDGVDMRAMWLVGQVWVVVICENAGQPEDPSRAKTSRVKADGRL